MHCSIHYSGSSSLWLKMFDHRWQIKPIEPDLGRPASCVPCAAAKARRCWLHSFYTGNSSATHFTIGLDQPYYKQVTATTLIIICSYVITPIWWWYRVIFFYFACRHPIRRIRIMGHAELLSRTTTSQNVTVVISRSILNPIIIHLWIC